MIRYSEAQFQAVVMQLARANGFKVAHFHDSRRQIRPGVHVGDRDAAGFPDLVLARVGRLIVAELKAEKGRLTPGQREWLAALDAAGVETHVWRPSDWDQIQRVLSITEDRRAA